MRNSSADEEQRRGVQVLRVAPGHQRGILEHWDAEETMNIGPRDECSESMTV